MLDLEFYISYKDVPVDIWERFISRKAVGLEINHLRAIEISNINDIHPYYFIGYSGSVPVGIAYCFSIQIDLGKTDKSYPPEIIETIRTWKPDFMDIRIVEVGHIASLGTTIEVNKPYLNDFIKVFSKKLNEIAQIENADLLLIRDIPTELYKEYEEFENQGFKPLAGYPIASIKLDWNSFDAYLDSLKSKKRINIRQKRSKLNKPEITVETIRDYAQYSERLAELWTNVAKRQNGYNHEHITPAYFEAMDKYMKERTNLTAIKLNGKIVAYGLNFVGDEVFFGVTEGLDYNFRDEYVLYANNIFEGLRSACELGKKTFNIGITAYNFKTSIGAELDPCVYYIKACKNANYNAVYADILQKNIPQPENIHHPFRNSNQINRIQPKDVEEILRNTKTSIDPFAKHYRYFRADSVRAAELYAYCPEFESAQEPIIRHKGRDIIMLGTNSYLGLATHPKIKEAAHNAIDKYGSGCSGSPLLNGTLDIHNELSDELARFTQKEASLIYSTGYQTNIGAISTLVGRNDVLIMDARNHASLLDGARLARANLVRYKHNDMESLEELLVQYSARPKLVVTDSLFSMEGTMIDLPNIVRLVKKYNARLMLDESHAIGVIGENGRGVAEHFGLIDDVDIIMGTFSKSLASIGGFIAGENKIIDTLKHTSRSHIFSASLPPSAVAAVLAALKIINEEPERRIKLLKNAIFLADGLKKLGYKICHHGSAIIPLFCGNDLLTDAAFHKLFEEGVFVNPVLHPAVPKNHEILRLSVMANHTEKMLQDALDVFERIRTPNGFPPDLDC